MLSETITELSIRELVDVFYERVRKDIVLAPVFESQLTGKWDVHLSRMYAFWTKVLLGTGDF
jgi:hemoglobin